LSIILRLFCGQLRRARRLSRAMMMMMLFVSMMTHERGEILKDKINFSQLIFFSSSSDDEKEKEKQNDETKTYLY
jgi:hypothetical protein